MSLTADATGTVARRRQHLLAVRDRVVFDGDVHPSDPDAYPPALSARLAQDPDYYHGRPISGDELLRDMDRAAVDMALCWQNPAVTQYGADPAANFEALLAANRFVARLGQQHPDRIIAAGWTDPKALGPARAAELVRIGVEEWGFPVVKMNPAQNAYRIDDESVLRLVDQIVELGAAPAFHFGGDTPFTPAEGLRTVAARHPGHPIIAVHMGGGGGHFVESDLLYLAARALGLECPNIFYILSAKRDVHMESDLIAYRAAGAPFRHNIAVASDAPYGRISWNFGGFRGMFASLSSPGHGDRRLKAEPALFDPDTVQDFMGRNLANLLIRIDTLLLQKGG